MANPLILLLAAGASTRMRGADKLLQIVDGEPQIRRVAQAALATGCRVVVALASDGAARSQALGDLALDRIVVTDATEGMAASIRAGARLAGPGQAVMILPADMPELDSGDLRTLLAAHEPDPQLILRGASGGLPGHPVLIPAALVPELQALHGDHGARAVLERHADRVRFVPLPGEHATLDLDTPEAWQSWSLERQARGVQLALDNDPAIGDPLQAALCDPENAVLAVITDVIGASYRRTGTLMAFFPGGGAVGDLTNGCIEHDVALHAADCLASGQVRRLRYGAGSPFFDIRLPCGGALQIGLYPRPDRSVLEEIARRRAHREFFALCLGDSGEIGLRGPQPTGWHGADYLVNLVPDIAFAVYGDGPEASVFTRLVHSAGYPHMLSTSSAKTLAAVLQAGGSGLPISGADVPILQPLDARTAVVTFFHDHDREIPILKAALQSPAFYVGAQGSLRVAERRQSQLLAAGVAPQAVARLHAPIGLIASARDPRTLAVSVLAEVIAVAEQGRIVAPQS